MTTMTAATIMATRLHTLAPDSRITEAMELFLKNQISGAPVVENGKLVGVLSEKDCMHFLVDGLMTNTPDATVSELMTREVQTIGLDVSVVEIAQLFLAASYRRLPVVDGDKLLGQVSRRDILRAIQDMHTRGSNPSKTPNVSKHEAATRQGSMVSTPDRLSRGVVGPETNKRFR